MDKNNKINSHSMGIVYINIIISEKKKCATMQQLVVYYLSLLFFELFNNKKICVHGSKVLRIERERERDRAYKIFIIIPPAKKLKYHINLYV